MCVLTLPFKENILDICTHKSENDEWMCAVKRHVLSCHDLVAAEARYHKSCYTKFRKVKYEPEQDKLNIPGRPADSKRTEYFEAICKWLESEGELYSLSEVHQKMIEVAGTEDVFSSKWLKTKLLEKYNDHIFFAEIGGKSNVVCLRKVADYFITDKWYSDRKLSSEDEAERIISAAAKLIIGDIRSAEMDCDYYPANELIECVDQGKDWLPPYLRLFMGKLIKSPIRQASIGQAIVNVTQTRLSVPPIPFGLGVELDNVFGSKWLLNELSALGFCVSPSEVDQ